MRSASKRLLAAAVVGASALATVLAPSPAMAVRQGADLDLTIREGGVPGGAVLDRVYLICDPDGGSHPTPFQACDSLDLVDGYFEALPSTGQPCPFIYDPVRVEAEGHWYGRTVRFARTYSNRCVAAAETDDVFNF